MPGLTSSASLPDTTVIHPSMWREMRWSPEVQTRRQPALSSFFIILSDLERHGSNLPNRGIHHGIRAAQRLGGCFCALHLGPSTLIGKRILRHLRIVTHRKPPSPVISKHLPTKAHSLSTSARIGPSGQWPKLWPRVRLHPSEIGSRRADEYSSHPRANVNSVGERRERDCGF